MVCSRMIRMSRIDRYQSKQNNSIHKEQSLHSADPETGGKWILVLSWATVQPFGRYEMKPEFNAKDYNDVLNISAFSQT